MNLLQQLTALHGPSGNESTIKSFIINYIMERSPLWKVSPTIIDQGVQDGLLLVFGEPRTAVYAHMDTVGFMVAYQNRLSCLGSPDVDGKWLLNGYTSKGAVSGHLQHGDGMLSIGCQGELPRGTTLCFAPAFSINPPYLTSPYLDNRLGVWVALQLCQSLQNGAISFTTHEEHRGGTAQNMARILFETYGTNQALVCDITWVTDGVIHGGGVAISLKDSYVPRKTFTDKIVSLAEASGIPYQLEVEHSGGSDGSTLQACPYPVDWCFVGAPERHAHSPRETVHLHDVESMLAMYKYLMEHL
ncbi:MAG: aminopeptidase [Bacteroidetes bacterium]|nr:aminopeptidase [Bacteroidota bacterium]